MAGHIEILRDFASPQEQLGRTLRIYLPPGVPLGTRARFPVLILQDGQNVYDHPESQVGVSWGVNTTLDHLIGAGRLPPVFVIAVDHRGVDRLGDYLPWPSADLSHDARGDRYVAFLVETLLPWAKEHLPISRDPQHTAVAGSSMGGLISLWAGLRHPTVFGAIGAFSPTVMAASRQMFRAWTRHFGGQHVYLDAGAHEHFDAGGRHYDYGGTVRDFAHHLRHLGYRDDLKVVLEPHGGHDEPSWRRRFPEAICWLLGGG